MYIIDRRWLIACIVTVAVLSGGYVVYAIRSIPRGGSPTGMTLGVIGTLLVVALMLLPFRKRQRHRSMGRLDIWMKTHVYLGVVCGVVVGMHAGFMVIGTISIGLTVVFVSTLLSGLAGTYLYETMPSTIARMGNKTVQQDALLEQIAEARQALDAFQSDKSEPFRQWVARASARRAMPQSLNPVHLIRWFRQRLAVRGDQAHPDMLSETERLEYGSAETLIARHTGLGRQLFYQQLLRQWLWMHVPLSTATCTLLLVHIIFELYY